ncbi:(2Fe-2S) ferredoxin domain-containing protein [Nonomuraea cavernae]|uniref:(2Fe-2S) ferredoxin domain-containing protein n=1 Tax=Nonomuraea cavernae TaxID=2045107 RepID=UPI0033D43FFC
MSRAASATAERLGCLITLCRGCCCGTAKKHPDVDHEDQPDRLRRKLTPPFRIRVVADCLGPCAHSNVVIVTPSPEGRAAGGRSVWLGFVLDEQVIDDIAAWVDTGGPGIADLPAILDLHVFTPPRRAHATSAPSENPSSGQAENSG